MTRFTLRIFTLGLVAAGIILSCEAPIGTGKYTGPAVGTTGANSASSNISRLLVSIPNAASLLPKSLQGNGTASGAGSANGSRRGLSRDITLNPTTLPSVQANGYRQMQQRINDSMLTTIITILKTIVNTLKVSNRMVLESDIHIGNITLPTGAMGPGGLSTFDAGAINFHQLDPNNYEVKWHLAGNYASDGGHGVGTQFVDYKLYLKLNFTPGATSTAEPILNDLILVVKGSVDGVLLAQVRGRYNTSTGTYTTVEEDPTDPINGGSVEQLVLTPGDAVHTVKYMRYSHGDRNAAYGDDYQGGVAYVGSWGNNSVKNVSTEFYNGTGDLLKTQWGQDSLHGGNDMTSWLHNYDNSVNFWSYLHAWGGSLNPLPDHIVLTATYSSNGWSYNSTTNSYTAPTITAFTWRPYDALNNPLASVQTVSAPTGLDNLWSMIYAAPADVSGSPGNYTVNWSSGDAVYFNSSYNYDSSTSTPVATITMKLGVQVPSATLLFGSNWYLENTFPLKYLRVASTLTGYAIRQKDLPAQTYTYTDSNGVLQTVSYTPSQFYLESPISRSPDVYDATKGDIDISDNTQLTEYWTWDDATGTSASVPIYEVRSTSDSPVGFDFQAQSLVDAVTAKIKSVATVAFQAAVDADSLAFLGDTIITWDKFPTTFPVFP